MDQMDRSKPLTKVRSLLRPAVFVGDESLSAAPEEAGAYAVAMHLAIPVRFESRQLIQDFSAGWYVYAGSAYGPGGIRARLCRHFRKKKELHWHVDRLTMVADDMHAVAIRNGSECEIVAKLARSRAFQAVADGFGSSDCKFCNSHLLAWRGE